MILYYVNFFLFSPAYIFPFLPAVWRCPSQPLPLCSEVGCVGVMREWGRTSCSSIRLLWCVQVLRIMTQGQKTLPHSYRLGFMRSGGEGKNDEYEKKNDHEKHLTHLDLINLQKKDMV